MGVRNDIWSELGSRFGERGGGTPLTRNSLENPPGYKATLAYRTKSLPLAQSDEQKMAIQLISIVQFSVKLIQFNYLFS